MDQPHTGAAGRRPHCRAAHLVTRARQRDALGGARDPDPDPGGAAARDVLTGHRHPQGRCPLPVEQHCALRDATVSGDPHVQGRGGAVGRPRHRAGQAYDDAAKRAARDLAANPLAGDQRGLAAAGHPVPPADHALRVLDPVPHRQLVEHRRHVHPAERQQRGEGREGSAALDVGVGRGQQLLPARVGELVADRRTKLVVVAGGGEHHVVARAEAVLAEVVVQVPVDGGRRVEVRPVAGRQHRVGDADALREDQADQDHRPGHRPPRGHQERGGNGADRQREHEKRYDEGMNHVVEVAVGTRFGDLRQPDDEQQHDGHEEDDDGSPRWPRLRCRPLLATHQPVQADPGQACGEEPEDRLGPGGRVVAVERQRVEGREERTAAATRRFGADSSAAMGPGRGRLGDGVPVVRADGGRLRAERDGAARRGDGARRRVGDWRVRGVRRWAVSARSTDAHRWALCFGRVARLHDRGFPGCGRLVRLNYLIAMKAELNSSIMHKANILVVLCHLSEFYHNQNKLFSDMTRDDIVSYLDTVRRPEDADPYHKWKGT